MPARRTPHPQHSVYPSRGGPRLGPSIALIAATYLLRQWSNRQQPTALLHSRRPEERNGQGSIAASSEQKAIQTSPDRLQRHTVRVDGNPSLQPPEGATGIGQVVVLIPAHNEEDRIAGSLQSLNTQSRPADRIIVIADNCTDNTAGIAAECGAEVIATVDNRHKKAGALNQVLARLLPTLNPSDGILVMDADSELDAAWIELAEARLQRGYAACGGVFTGRPGARLVGMFQRNEFARYQRDVRRQNGKTLVLTGTATLFSASVLTEVIEARRSGRLPGEPRVYDVKVLTEDNELTLALLHLGHKIVAPAECHLTTEVMDTWGDLHRQRLRWKRGAIENLFQYGLTRHTFKYWLRQLLSALGLFVSFAYLATLIGTLALTGTVRVHPLWMAITGIFVLEQAITVRDRGWKMSVLAAALVVEMPYDFFLQATHARALWNALRNSERRW